MTNKLIGFAILLTISILSSNCANKSKIEALPSTGVYDCLIGKDQLIMVIEESTADTASGYYLHNRNNAVEEVFEIRFAFDNDKLRIISSEYEGIFSGFINENKLHGNFKQFNNKRFFLFWKNNLKVNSEKRTDKKTSFQSRYNNQIFDKITVRNDVVYGRALGYWTQTPYLDDPYIEILGRGMINFFKAPKMLDLKMDIYQPISDSLKQRPLVLIMHGGGFYIGNKQSVTEQILANTFTKRGYVVASIDYRMGFKLNETSIERSAYRTLQDVDAALRYLSHNAKKYRIDPNHVFVTGTSAGAIAALSIAFMQNSERPEKSYEVKNRDDLGTIESSGNKYKERFKIKAVGSMWGALNDTTIIDKNEQIPVIMFHGTSDFIVPFGHDYPFKNTLHFNRLLMGKLYGSEVLKKRLDNLHIENKLILFEGKGHEPQLSNFKTINELMDTINHELVSFFHKQMVPKVMIDQNQLTIKKDAPLTPLEFKIDDGITKQLEIQGGIQVSDKYDETSIIWIKNEAVHQVTLITTNRFEAIGKKTFTVNILE